MIIKLTNEFDNHVWVNTNLVTYMELCEYGERKHLGIRLWFGPGHSLVVQECYNKIKKLMEKP